MQHRVYTSLTKPMILLGVPLVIFIGEILAIAMFWVILRIPIWFLGVFPLAHLFFVYLTSQDNHWYKTAYIKGKYFSKGNFKGGRTRYNA